MPDLGRRVQALEPCFCLVIGWRLPKYGNRAQMLRITEGLHLCCVHLIGHFLLKGNLSNMNQLLQLSTFVAQRSNFSFIPIHLFKDLSGLLLLRRNSERGLWKELYSPSLKLPQDYKWYSLFPSFIVHSKFPLPPSIYFL